MRMRRILVKHASSPAMCDVCEAANVRANRPDMDAALPEAGGTAVPADSPCDCPSFVLLSVIVQNFKGTFSSRMTENLGSSICTC